MVDEADALSWVERVAELNPEMEISLCDTTSNAAPDQVGRMMRHAITHWGPRFAYHGHDTYGLGLASMMAAWDAGCRVFDAGSGGIGGCPYAPGATGNTAMEDAVWMFHRMGVETGVNWGRLLEAADLTAEIGGQPGGRVRGVPGRGARPEGASGFPPDPGSHDPAGRVNSGETARNRPMPDTPFPPSLLIGCGKMGGAMLAGWLELGLPPETVVVEPHAAAVTAFAGRVRHVASIAEIPAGFTPGAIILATKPQEAPNALPALAHLAHPGTVFLSIMAGRTVAGMNAMLGGNAHVVRAMPNTPAAVRLGFTVAYPGPGVTEAQRQLCHALLSAIGEAAWVDRNRSLIRSPPSRAAGRPMSSCWPR